MHKQVHAADAASLLLQTAVSEMAGTDTWRTEACLALVQIQEWPPHSWSCSCLSRLVPERRCCNPLHGRR